MIDSNAGISIGLAVVAGGAVFGYGRLNQRVDTMQEARKQDHDDISKKMDKFEGKLDRMSEMMLDVRVVMQALKMPDAGKE